MVPDLFFYELGLIALLWLCVMLQWAWPSDPATVCPTAPESPPPRPKRTREPKPFAGLTHKPHCDACAQVQRQLQRNESARFYHHRTRKCMPPRKLRREIQ